MQLLNEKGLDKSQLHAFLNEIVECNRGNRNILLVAPDITRMHSQAGAITSYLYSKMSLYAKVTVLIALGSHVAMTKEEAERMYCGIPFESIVNHNWRHSVMKLGVVDKQFVEKISTGLCSFPIDVEINRLVFGGFDSVISIGQVVPHEVVGMANGNKNLFVGCGGSSMINSSHMLGAVCDMEKVMGRDHSPVREVFDYAEKQYLQDLNLTYILTVIADGNIVGLFAGKKRDTFEQAVLCSQRHNLNFLDKPLKKVIVKLDEDEFRSTWLGNKSIYRTRMAIQDGGELIVLAGGVERFGEDEQIDRLIYKYGYVGRDKVLTLAQSNNDLKNNLSAAAHLIHGSSNGRFGITYAVKKLTREQVEKVNFKYADYDQVIRQYDCAHLTNGFNNVNGEEIYYIDNPAVGLWAYKDNFYSKGE